MIVCAEATMDTFCGTSMDSCPKTSPRIVPCNPHGEMESTGEKITKPNLNHWSSIAKSVGSYLEYCKSSMDFYLRGYGNNSMGITGEARYLKEMYDAVMSQSLKSFGKDLEDRTSGNARSIVNRNARNVSAWEEKLRRSFCEQTVEDGHIHPGEKILRGFIRLHKEVAFLWIKSVMLTDNPNLVPGMITCLGRLSPDNYLEEMFDIMREALRHQSVSVRDAAVQAIENWGEGKAVFLLTNHREEVPWLRDYISVVINKGMVL